MKKFDLSSVASLSLVSLCLPLSSLHAQEKKQPNILFCIADDAGLHMGAYGTKWVNTPGFDRVAKEGILFERAYTVNAKSSPSRAAILTGRNSWQLEDACNHNPFFPAKFKSFPEALSENGYTVGYTGKGWSPGIAIDSLGKQRKLTGVMWSSKKLTPPSSGISNIDYAENFNDFLNQRPKDKPFCFWFGALEPHRQYEYGSSLKVGKSIDQIDSVPAFWPDNEIVRTDMLDYAMEVEHFDTQLSRILKMLEDAGELNNTIIVVTSDHGMPFPRCKGQEYEYSNHIPMAVMWKNGIQNPTRKVNEYISFIDLAPTFLELAGLTAEKAHMKPITGRSFSDILKNKKQNIDRDFVLIGKERHDVGRPNDQGYPIRGIIRGDYLYLKNFKTNRWPACNPETGYLNVDESPTKTEVLKARRDSTTRKFWDLSFGKRQSEELYNIKTDKECMNNLVSQPKFKTLKNKLKKELYKKLTEQQDPRIIADGSIFDKYVYSQPGERLHWNKRKAGSKVKMGWANPSDYEPEASGLLINWDEPGADD